jgi:hypothetical protein
MQSLNEFIEKYLEYLASLDELLRNFEVVRGENFLPILVNIYNKI